MTRGPLRTFLRCSSTASSGLKSYVDIAAQQKLYMIDKSTPGSVFFLPHGARLFDRLVSFMRDHQHRFGFEHVITPLIYKSELWKTSGHWQHYRRDMFHVSGEEHGHAHSEENDSHDFSLKPMNCPGHCVMFGQYERSFRELPVRYSDFSPLHRNEASGALTGLTRVRKFHQDDGHIFCEHSQIEQEIGNCLKLIDSVYTTFDLSNYKLTLSTRPEEYAGDLPAWEQAEADLRQVLEATGKPWTINEGDGAFYGPKIDVLVTDFNGKEHQTATIQLDFQLPKSFDLKYASSGSVHGETKTPVLIHRAVYGSLERFMAMLIDHYQGKWPFWLNPRQAVVIPVAARHFDYAKQVEAFLTGRDSESNANRFHAELAAQDETVGVRIRRAIEEGASYIIMVGDREIEQNTVTIRTRDSRKTESVTLQELASLFNQLIADKN
uniref:threonine--tRNA ligase n=1 Tax=Blastobotrys adeninivorans TaxID=409370 RepID=A0A060SYQ3_BLAAD